MDHGQKHDINRLVTAIKLANLKIHDEAQRNPNCRGMGTTLVSTVFAEDAMIVGHVGDSRSTGCARGCSISSPRITRCSTTTSR